MHELGIMFYVVEGVLEIVRKNELSEVESIVLEVGTASAVVPRFLEECFPAAADGTILEGTKLKIETTGGSAFNIKEIIAC